MEINEVNFVASYPEYGHCPKDLIPEYAFIGRSNVGKSSLINMITGRKALAKVSGTPGKTQLINFFHVDDSWHLVDLPGYGYARVSKTARKKFERMIQGYLLNRVQLQCTFLLVDINVPPQPIDLEFINWMGQSQIPFVIVFTKADRKKTKDKEGQITAFNMALLETWETLPQQFMTSSTSGMGREEILEFIGSINKTFYEEIDTFL
ncbi:MAG: ribosome biogenesis GTP-binding protein YihA/YsxC [Bacteroidota bacterium]